MNWFVHATTGENQRHPSLTLTPSSTTHDLPTHFSTHNTVNNTDDDDNNNNKMATFQHKYSKVCSTGHIITFIVDVLTECRGQPFACVLMNAAEVAVFHHEATSTNAISADRLAVLVEANDFWADSQGKLWLMTYPQLSDILAVPGVRPKHDLTLLLHMGCGEYTWDIVKGSLDLWKWAQGFEGSLQKPIISVYTISNIEESIYRDASATPLSTVGFQRPRVEWLQPEAFDTAIAQLQQDDATYRELCKNVLETQKRPLHTNRTVVFKPESKLLETCSRHSWPSVNHVELTGSMTGIKLTRWIELLIQDQYDAKTLLVGPDVGTIGTVHNLGTVLVLPVKEGWFFDKRVSCVVFRRDIPMSQAEVRYACRVACNPSDSRISPLVSVFTTKNEFDKLPSTPTDLPAFTVDFPAVLLHLCDHSYFDAGKSSPIRLPSDEKMVDECLRRLEMRGLTVWHGGPLTELGRLTAWWYQSGGIRDFKVANLLAIAWTAQGARASALIQVAAVLYQPDSSLMSPIARLLKFQIPEGMSAELEGLLVEAGEGFARSYVARGPIWIAVAIWATQRKIMRQAGMCVSTSPGFRICHNMLFVSQPAINMIQKSWETMRQAWTNGLGGAQLSQDPTINDQDFLFLEESIVRVWMYNLVLVSMEDSELSAFACDLASGSPVGKPAGDPVNWARLTEELGSEPFGVYTALHRITGPDGKVQYGPENLNFVATSALRHVLRNVAASKARIGCPPLTWQDLLRSKYPLV